MKIRAFSAAGLMLALAGCTTTATTVPIVKAPSPIEQRWVGQSAGGFFASFGPPIADRDEGGNRVYTWRGGYATIQIPASHAKPEEGQKVATRAAKVNCKAEIVTSPNYTIREIHILGDPPGATGPSYCTELLVPPPAAAKS
jgi:hypothetical protein